MQLKQALFRECKRQIQQRIDTINEVLASIQESRNNETKSSVGDKYETGRAMMQMEEDKNKAQLLQAIQAKNVLSAIDPEKQNTVAQLGSLVITPTSKYYLAIGLGKILIDNELVYAISLDSPIGQLLRQRKTGEEVVFQQRTIAITAII